MKKVADLVYDEIKPLFNGDIKLLAVEYTKKSDGMHLSVYIDKEDGITIDDCTYVNNLIADRIEDLNPTDDQSYFLDVSSYGLDKPLKFDWQFKKYIGKKVDVKLYQKIDDKKEFTAILKAKNEKSVDFELDNENFEIDLSQIAYILPHIEF